MRFSICTLYILFLSGVLGAFLEDKLPLKVLSITPSELSRVGQTNRQAVLLRGIDPITVVFTRPVIALGSDFQALDRNAQGGMNNAPFTLRDLQGKELNIAGKLRWATTYIARFDPDTTWPTDLEFTLNFNPNLQTYDGVTLSNTEAPPAFQTPFLSGSYQSIDSKLGQNATGSSWSPRVGNEAEVEAPPDAEIRYQFSHPVNLEMIRKAFALSVKAGALGRAAVEFAACPPLRDDMRIFDFAPQREEDLSACVLIKPSNLAPDASYMLTLPAGTTYHEKAGATHTALTFIFHGLYPFTFTPQQFTQWFQPRYRRLDFYLRHGLETNADLSHFQRALTISSPNNANMPFEVSRPDNVTLRVQANFNPAQQYRILFRDAPIRDGFGQTFKGMNFSFTTAETNSIFSEPTNNNDYTVFARNNAPSTWKLMTRGGGANNQQQQMTLSLGAVTPANFASSLQSRGYQASKFPTSITSQSPQNAFRIQNLTLPSDFFLRQREYASFDGSKNYQGAYTSITDLGVSIVASGASVDVWVTNLTSGANIPGAEVSIYTHQSWNNQGPATLIGTKTTGPDGTLKMDTPKNENGGQYLLYVSKAVGGRTDQTFVEYYPGFASEQPVSATVVMDRGVYKPGDTINLKVFATKKDGLTMKPFTEAGCSMQIHWEQPRPPTWQPIQQQINVEWDSTYGTWFTSLEIPSNVTFGAKTLSVVSANQMWITSATVLIADPRRPTASLEFSADSIWVLGEQLNITAKVLTGTNQPIANAKVEVKWHVITYRPLGAEKANLDNVNGSFVITTGEDGTVSKRDFTLNGLKADESYMFDATYVGPTGEVLQQSAHVSTATSKWSLSLEPDSKYSALTQLPGFEFGWNVRVRDENGNEKPASGSIELYPANSDKSVRSCQFNKQAGNTAPVCTGFTLPSIGAFTAVATARDDKNRIVSANYSLGRSDEDWKNNPLTKYHLQDFGFSLDKNTYAVGDNARVQFDCPFTGATAWLVGNDINQQAPASVGKNELTFRVPQSCLGGCSLAVVIAVPAQPAAFAQKVRASNVPISVWMDLRAPRSFQSSLQLNVPDNTRQLNVAIAPPAKSSPGDNVKFTVTLTDRNNAPVTGEVAIFVVDRAFIQVSPYPLVHINESFVVSSNEYRSTFDNRQNLVSWSGAEISLSKFATRLAQEPWADYSEHQADLSDEDFFRHLSTRVTQWGSGNIQMRGRAAPGVVMASSFSAERMVAAPMMMAAAAPMALEVADSSVQQSKMSTQAGDLGFGGAAAAPGEASTDMPVRTKFETAPLFIGRRVVQGSGQFDLQLPDNIGTFTIRAYAVDANSRFGQAEAEVVSTKALTIQPMFPRFARPGDVFDSGVIVSGDSASYNSQVTVNVRASNSTVKLIGRDSAQVQVRGTTPVKVKFPMSAEQLGDSNFRFTAQDSARAQDAFEDGFDVLPTQDPVTIATSMAIQASPDGKKWDEGISFPAMIPGSGSLGLTAAVGRLPAVETLAFVVLNATQRTSPDEDAYLWLSRALLRNVFTRYPSAVGPAETLAQEQFSGTVEALKRLTDPRLGLRWSNRNAPNTWETSPDTALNFYGVYTAFRSYLHRNPADINRSPFRGMKTPTTPANGAQNPQMGGPRMGGPQMAPPQMGGVMSSGPVMGRAVAGGPGDNSLMMQPMSFSPPDVQAPADMMNEVFEAPPAPPRLLARPGRRLLQANVNLLPLELVQQWAMALERGLVTQYYDAVRYGRNFSDWDMLANALTVLGLDWTGPKLTYTPVSGPLVPAEANPSSVLSARNLQANLDKLSYGGQVQLALAYLLRGESNPIIGRVVNQTIERILVQGSTAYLKAGSGSNNAASTDMQAAALELLALTDAKHPFVEKLANFLAQGNAANAGSFYSFSPKSTALSCLSLAVYDQAKQNMNANAVLKVTSGQQTLLDATFRAANTKPVSVKVNPDTLPQKQVAQDGRTIAPEGLQFTAQGQGEVSVAALIDFVPAVISPDPIFRGIYVERTIQRAEGGKGAGPSLQLVQAGEFVVVTIQITSPDDLTGVFIQDLLPGGLEAVDPRLSGSGGDVPPMPQPLIARSSRFIFPPWRDPFGSANVYPDRVTWQADWLRQGTYSVTYTAVAVTSGTFLHPPTKVMSVPQPEVMGLSGGGFLVVSEEPIPQASQEKYLKDRNVAPVQPLRPIECKTPCPSTGYCNLRTGQCEPMVEMRTLGAIAATPIPTSQGTTSGKAVAGKAKAKAGVAVRALAASKITPTSLDLTWNAAPGQEGPYAISFRKAGGKVWRKLADNLTTRSFTVTDLAAQTEYQFRVETAGKFSTIKTRTA